ncbi:MAG: 30S ribosomal protein S17 [Candidatus Paceibacterota bacterium]
MTTKTTQSKQLEGIVVSDKMKDTVVVVVDEFIKHPKYHKFIRRQKKYAAHDEGNQAHVGQKVTIEATRPISKTKRFKVVSREE